MATDVLSSPAVTDPVDATPTVEVRLPLWFEVGLLLAVLGVVCCGGLGVALACAGAYSFGVSVGIGLPLVAVLTGVGAWALRGRAGERPDRRGGAAPALVAVVLAAVDIVWNALHAGPTIIIDRDTGIYAVTAKWLTQHGNLTIPWRADWDGTGLPLLGNSFGVDDVDGELGMHFNHLTAVLFAQAGTLGGDLGLLRANALLTGLGLLAVYAVGVRLTRRPWLTLAGVVGLAFCLPVVYIARATWSEGLTMLLVWAAVWLLVTAWERSPRVLGLLAGLVLGATVMARIDALIYLLPLGVLAGVVAVVLGRDDRWRRFAGFGVAVLVGVAAPIAIGRYDVVHTTGSYYRVLTPQIEPLETATFAAAVVGVLGLLLARPLRPVVVAAHRRLPPRSAAVPAVLGLATTVILLLALALRPGLQTTRGRNPIGLIGTLQRREGVPVDANRLYSERSLTWLGWYLGAPVVLLGAVGLGLLVRRALRGSVPAVLVLGTVGAASLFYLYRLSITPDHLFGMRRFVPAVFPLFALAAAVAVAALADRLPSLLPPARRYVVRPVLAVLAAGIAFSPLATTGPLRALEPHTGLLDAVTAVCRTTGPDAALVFPYSSYGQTTGLQTFRSWCDVPVVGSRGEVSADELRQAARVMATRGRTLWVIDSGDTYLRRLFGAASVQTFGTAAYTRDPTLTLTHPPRTYTPFTITYYGVQVPTS